MLHDFDEYGSMASPYRGIAGSIVDSQQLRDGLDSLVRHFTSKGCATHGQRPPPKEETQDRPSMPHQQQIVQQHQMRRTRFGFHRGCEWGLCCVYSMWYDPGYRCLGRCSHVCRHYKNELCCCGPSILSDSVRSRAFEQYTRRNQGHIDRSRIRENQRLCRQRTTDRRKRNINQKTAAPLYQMCRIKNETEDGPTTTRTATTTATPTRTTAVVCAVDQKSHPETKDAPMSRVSRLYIGIPPLRGNVPRGKRDRRARRPAPLSRTRK